MKEGRKERKKRKKEKKKKERKERKERNPSEKGDFTAMELEKILKLLIKLSPKAMKLTLCGT